MFTVFKTIHGFTRGVRPAATLGQSKIEDELQAQFYRTADM